MSKTLLVTGGAGFVAHHVIEYFLDNTDWKIISLDRLDFSGNLNRLHEITKNRTDKNRVSVVHHDLRAPINSQIAKNLGNVNIILHLAAASHVTRSIQFPLEFVESNINGTVNLLEYARTLDNLERFFYFSTDEVFGPAIPNKKFTEFDRFNATNPYSASKAAGESMCVAYHNTYNLPIYISHTMNIIGERQNPEKYVPMVIKKILNDDPITIHYNSKTNEIGSRCYLHAKDVADAIYFILNLPEIKYDEHHFGGKCPKFNVASTIQYDNLEIATKIALSLNKNIKIEMIDPFIDRPGHDFSYQISGEYLNKLGWSPKISIDTRLPELTSWYANNQDWLK